MGRMSVYNHAPNDLKAKQNYLEDQKKVDAAVRILKQNKKGNLCHIKSAVAETQTFKEHTNAPSDDEKVSNNQLKGIKEINENKYNIVIESNDGTSNPLTNNELATSNQSMNNFVSSPMDQSISKLSGLKSAASILNHDNNALFAKSIPTASIPTVEENVDVFDEDSKMSSLLQSYSNLKDYNQFGEIINYQFIPNGLLTYSQFVEFLRILNINDYDEKLHLGHMFRYMFNQELPNNLPPPPLIGTVNGMYCAYSECIGYEYDELKQFVDSNQDYDFDDLLRSAVIGEMQIIYETLKFDEVDRAKSIISQDSNNLKLPDSANNNSTKNGQSLSDEWEW